MKKVSYFKYIRLNNNRRSKDSLYLMYKGFLDIFLEEDKNKIMDFLLKSAKCLIVVPVFFMLALYTILGSLYSAHIIEGLLFSGLISILHSIFLIHSKYGEVNISAIKKDFEFVLRLIPKRKVNAFIIHKISLEYFHSSFIYTGITYLIAVFILYIFVNQSLWVLSGGILLVLLNFLMGFTFLFINITRLHERVVKGLITLFVAAFSIILLNSFNLKRIYPFDLDQLIIPYFRDSGDIFIDTKVIFLFSMIMGGIFLSLSFVFYCLQTKSVVPAILVINEESFYKLFSKKHIFQRLLLRGFDSKRKLLYIRGGSLLLTSIIILLYPFLNQNDKIPLALTILLFCYSPAIFNLLITHYLYNELLQKPFTRTTYYFIKKYSCKKYLYKYTIQTTFSQLFILLLPFLTLTLLYRPLNVFWTVSSYVLVFIIIVTILVARIFNTGKFSYEEIKIMEAPVLTSKSTENFIVFGIPIFYAIPVLSLTLAQSQLLYIYISTLIYTFVLLLFCVIKLYLSLAKEGKNAASL
ncbi:hypothetical protein [Peribacillus simplex]|uniref:hypothetical protein n=1 Tax=Peribacillus simplex TaxID=1478 RepID=UPI003D2E4896